jgi:hypothetical protein
MACLNFHNLNAGVCMNMKQGNAYMKGFLELTGLRTPHMADGRNPVKYRCVCISPPHVTLQQLYFNGSLVPVCE